MQVLTPIFDPGFSESSFGFRPKRSAHGATKQVQQHIQAGYRHCVDMDLAKFFDKVQHDVLLARVSRKVHDKRLLGLIGRYLRAGIMVEASYESTYVDAAIVARNRRACGDESTCRDLRKMISAGLTESSLPNLGGIGEVRPHGLALRHLDCAE